MLQSRLATFLECRAALMGCHTCEPGVKRQARAYTHQIHLHLDLAMLNRNHHSQLWHRVDDVQAIEDAIVLSRGLKNGDLWNGSIIIVLVSRLLCVVFHLYS